MLGAERARRLVRSRLIEQATTPYLVELLGTRAKLVVWKLGVLVWKVIWPYRRQANIASLRAKIPQIGYSV